jgi:bifunctional UDP-N-acetylglucosamine pyrophosphorylase/glucosamine-1-phosphate N-acetyltransferase
VETGQGLLAVILAAGQGTRMRSSQPKILHPLAGQPLVSYPIGLARALGATAIVVVHAPGQADLLEPVCAGCELVAQEEAEGTGHAVNVVPERLRGAAEVLILYGDVPLLTLETSRALLRARRDTGAEGALLAARVAEPRGYGRVVQEGNQVSVVEEKDLGPREAGIDLVNTGICAFRSAALWPVLRAIPKSPVTGEYYLTAVFERLERATVLQCAEEEALGVNDRWQLAAAERVVRRRINRAHAEAGVTIVDPDSTFIDAGVRIASDTVIEPFTFIRGSSEIGLGCHVGPFAEITDCRIGRGCSIGRSHLVESVVEDDVVIGPFNRLRAGSVIGARTRLGNYAEVKNSSVGPDSDLHHFSYIGDTVMGRRVNIGAGTVTANYDGFAKHRTTIGDEVFIGTDTTLVAPVTVGDRAYTAAGSVITRDVPPDALAIERGEQRQVEGYAARKRARQGSSP